MYIWPEYERCFGSGSYERDYQNEHMFLFYSKINVIGGAFSELLKARDILINRRDVDSQTKKWARQFARPDIDLYLQESMENAASNELDVFATNLEKELLEINTSR